MSDAVLNQFTQAVEEEAVETAAPLPKYFYIHCNHYRSVLCAEGALYGF